MFKASSARDTVISINVEGPSAEIRSYASMLKARQRRYGHMHQRSRLVSGETKPVLGGSLKPHMCDGHCEAMFIRPDFRSRLHSQISLDGCWNDVHTNRKVSRQTSMKQHKQTHELSRNPACSGQVRALHEQPGHQASKHLGTDWPLPRCACGSDFSGRRQTGRNVLQ